MDHAPGKPPRPREVPSEGEGNLECIEEDNAYHLFMLPLSTVAVETAFHPTNRALSGFSQKTRSVTILEMLFSDGVNLL